MYAFGEIDCLDDASDNEGATDGEQYDFYSANSSFSFGFFHLLPSPFMHSDGDGAEKDTLRRDSNCRGPVKRSES